MVAVIRQEEREKQEETIDATPTAKGTFLALIRGGYTLPDAVAEYVDNSIEQARIIGPSKDGNRRVEIQTKTEGSEGIIEIYDNCGGCARNDAVRFVRPGESGVNPAEGNISRFGIGGKAAGLAVSSSVEIISRTHSEEGWKIVLDREDILNKSDWKFKVTGLTRGDTIPEGGTKIRLHILNFSDFQSFPINGKLELEQRYGIADLTSKVDILFNGEKINTADPEADILNEVEAPEHCDPLEVKGHIRVPTREKNETKTREIYIRIKIGLMTEGSRINKFGMNIYCNGRLLVKDNKIGIYDKNLLDEKIGHAGSQLIWLRGIVYLNGPAEAMPWNSRKNDIDISSPTYAKLEQILKKAVDDFMEKVADAKKELKDLTGEKRLPDIRDVIVSHYYKEILKDRNYENKVREIVRHSRPFSEAKKKVLQHSGDTKEEPHEVPIPPHNDTTTYLAASVENYKIEKVKKKIGRAYGKSNISNADVVRITLEHYLNCDRT